VGNQVVTRLLSPFRDDLAEVTVHVRERAPSPGYPFNAPLVMPATM
jgi:hypothetical protein